MRWNPKQWWAGQDAFVVGGGPSLENFDWKRLRGRLVVGCNDAYCLGPSICTVCVFGDMPWYYRHRPSLAEFPNPVITNQPSLNVGSPDWLLTLPRREKGLHRDAIGWNGNTGAAAINVALILGARRVFLLGFDMKRRGKRTNWHDQNIGNPNDESYRRFRQGFQNVAEALPRVFRGREVINLGPDSALDVFPKANWAEYLRPEGDSYEGVLVHNDIDSSRPGDGAC